MILRLFACPPVCLGESRQLFLELYVRSSAEVNIIIGRFGSSYSSSPWMIQAHRFQVQYLDAYKICTKSIALQPI